MFRMEFENIANSLIVRVEGRFVGHFAEEARVLIARRHIPPTLIVDITEVTFVDSNGEDALTWVSEIGGRFVAESSYALDVCERLGLPVVTKQVGDYRGQISAD